MVGIDEVESGIAEAIEALSSTAWVQGAATTATWRRCPVPLTARVDERLRAHLAYSVSIEGLSAAGDGDDEEVPVVGDLVAVFYFRIRRDHELADIREAQRAAVAVHGAMLARASLWATWPTTPYTPGPIEGGEWLPIAVRCGVGFALPITTAKRGHETG